MHNCHELFRKQANISFNKHPTLMIEAKQNTVFDSCVIAQKNYCAMNFRYHGLQRKSVLNIHWKDWCWSWSSSIWPPNVKSGVTRKDPDAGKDWRQKEKERTEDEMVGWHHRLNGHEFQQAPGDGEGQESLVCCSPWVAMSRTQLSYWTELKAVTPIPASCASLSKFHLTSLSFSVHICKMGVIIAISVVCKDQ